MQVIRPRPVQAGRVVRSIVLFVLANAALPSIAAPVTRPLLQNSRANPPVAFAHLSSDLAVDPRARFGRLPNGITYVIYRNATPPGTATVAMRVAAGSVMEDEGQQGLAHFVEHMAFQGSTNVQEGEMVKLLERDGLQFGADTNAETSFFSTIYTLQIPNARQSVLDHALFLMRETAGNLKFYPDAIARQRGVILGEERVRASAGMQSFQSLMSSLLPAAKYARRLPIGKVAIIQEASRAKMVRFYNTFYRPEYTTLVVVGDIDSDRIENEIRKRFSDWKPVDLSGTPTSYGRLTRRKTPAAKQFIANGLPTTISINWTQAPVGAPETKAKDLEDSLFAIGNDILSQRLARAAKLPQSAFIEAGLLRQEITHTARFYSFNVVPKEGQDRLAFAQAVGILRTLVQNGPSPVEVDRFVRNLTRRYEEQIAGARTVTTGSIAARILQTLSTQSVLQSPAQELAEIQDLKPSFTAPAVAKAMARIGLNTPPLIFRQSDRAEGMDERQLLLSYATAMNANIAPASGAVAVAWPYTYFGAPTHIVKKAVVPGTGATQVTFANGVTLNVKQTHFEDDAVHVAVQLGNGLLGVRPEQGAALFMAKQVGIVAGGLNKITSDALRDALAGHIFGADFSIGTNASQLGGTTTRTDLATQLQVLAAFVTDPALSGDVLDRVKTALPASYSSSKVTPDGVFALEAQADLYGRDPRFSVPPLKEAMAVSSADVMSLLRDQLGRGPVDITIVGDVEPTDAITEVARTFGAFSERPRAATVPGAYNLRFPSSDLHRVYTHSGRPDQNLSGLAWPTTGYYADLHQSAGLEVLASILTLREIAEVREKQGATYSASASSSMSRTFPDFGFIWSRASVRPEANDQYVATIGRIVDDLKQRPVSNDELTRARFPIIERLRSERNSNGYWLSVLTGEARDPRLVAAYARHERDLLSITAQDVQGLAGMYLDMNKALRIQVRPSTFVK